MSGETEVVKYEDPSLGIYKKLTLSKNRLQGVILVGDATDSHRYAEWLPQQDGHPDDAPHSAVPRAGGPANR